MMKTQTKYILVNRGSNTPICYGSITDICNEWCKKRYQDAPDEEFSVFEVIMTPSKELNREEIEEVVDKAYDKYME